MTDDEDFLFNSDNEMDYKVADLIDGAESIAHSQWTPPTSILLSCKYRRPGSSEDTFNEQLVSLWDKVSNSKSILR